MFHVDLQYLIYIIQRHFPTVRRKCLCPSCALQCLRFRTHFRVFLMTLGLW